jgi:hypothetical protein
VNPTPPEIRKIVVGGIEVAVEQSGNPSRSSSWNPHSSPFPRDYF